MSHQNQSNSISSAIGDMLRSFAYRIAIFLIVGVVTVVGVKLFFDTTLLAALIFSGVLVLALFLFFAFSSLDL